MDVEQLSDTNLYLFCYIVNCKVMVTNYNNVDIFKEALSQLLELTDKLQSNILINSIEFQLKYLIDLEEGRQKDRSRLAEINLCLIAAREIESKNDDLANILYEVNSIVKIMMTEK